MSNTKEKNFMSLYEYRGHKDIDGTGKELSNYAKLIGAPVGEKTVSHSPYSNGKINTYLKETIDSFFRVKNLSKNGKLDKINNLFKK